MVALFSIVKPVFMLTYFLRLFLSFGFTMHFLNSI